MAATGLWRAGVVVLSGLVLWAAPAAAQVGDSISGPATVIDGSTLRVDRTKVRFVGAVAPGLAQTCQRHGETWPCGKAAAHTLSSLIAGRPVRCSLVSEDIDGTLLGLCFAGETELNRAMVGAGMALAQTQAGLDYGEPQAIAKAARAGLWAGNFVDPNEWRQQHAADAVPPHS